MPQEGFANRREVRVALAEALDGALPPGLQAVNDAGEAEDIAATREAVTASVLGLNLTVFDRLLPEMQDAVLQAVIDYIQENGPFSTVPDLQAVVDAAVEDRLRISFLTVYEDAHIQEGQPDTNFGHTENLIIRTHVSPGTWATLLKFDISDVDYNPEDIMAVELCLYMIWLTWGGWNPPAGTTPPYVLAVREQPLGRDHSWSQDTVTWNNAPGVGFNVPGRPWDLGLDSLHITHGGSIAHLLIGDPSYTQETIGAWRPNYINRWHYLDITTYIRQALLRGDDYVTLMVFEGTLAVGQRRGAQMDFASSRHPNAVNFSPRLRFTTLCFDDYSADIITGVNPPSAGTAIVTGGNRHVIGRDITVTANANTGFEFINWTGDLTGSSNPFTFELTGDTNLTANFRDLVAEVNAATDTATLLDLLQNPNLGLRLRLLNSLQQSQRDEILADMVATDDFASPSEIQSFLDNRAGKYLVLTELVVSEDAYVSSTVVQNDSPRGSVNPSELRVRTRTISQGHYATFLKFDISGLSVESSDIELIELELYMTGLEFGLWEINNNNHIPPYNLAVRQQPLGPDHSWSENTITWNNAPGVGSWGAAGGDFGGHPNWSLQLEALFMQHGGVIDHVIFGEATDTIYDLRAKYLNTWFSLNVTDFVRDAITRGDNYVTLLVFEGPTGGSRRSSTMTFASKEHGNGPRLQIISTPVEGPPVGEAPEIIVCNAPGGMVGAPYSFQFLATGDPTPTWSVTGELPHGLSFCVNGSLTGTPQLAGTFIFTVTVSNTEGSDSRTITVMITLPPPCREELARAIAYVRALDPTDFTIFSWIEVYDELRNALLVYNNENALQAQIDLAESRLRARVAALVTAPPVTVLDFTALDLAIADAASRQMQNYNIFTWFDLQDELVRARNVRNNPNVNQTQVDTAAARLEAVLGRL